MIKIIHQAHPGHFIGASRCQFRLNTAIEDSLSGRSVIVSTVGDYYATYDEFGEPKQIGVGRTHETMVFNARRNPNGRLCCPFEVISFCDTLDSMPYSNSDEAFVGHNKLVKKWTKVLRTKP